MNLLLNLIQTPWSIFQSLVGSSAGPIRARDNCSGDLSAAQRHGTAFPTTVSCYHPDGEEAQGFQTCVARGAASGSSPCCPEGFACSGNETSPSCIVVDRVVLKRAHEETVDEVASLRVSVACTDPSWDEVACGTKPWVRQSLSSRKSEAEVLLVRSGVLDGQSRGRLGDEASLAVERGMARSIEDESQSLTLGPTLHITIPPWPRSTSTQDGFTTSSRMGTATLDVDTASSSSGFASHTLETPSSTTTSSPRLLSTLVPSPSPQTTEQASSPTRVLTGIQTIVPTYPPTTSSSSSSSSASKSSLATKLGLGLGIPLLVALVLALTACLHARQRRRRRRKLARSAPPFDFDAPEVTPISVADFAHIRHRRVQHPQMEQVARQDQRGSQTWRWSGHSSLEPPLVPRRSSARLSSSRRRRGEALPGPLRSNPIGRPSFVEGIPEERRVRWREEDDYYEDGPHFLHDAEDLDSVYASYSDLEIDPYLQRSSSDSRLDDDEDPSWRSRPDHGLAPGSLRVPPAAHVRVASTRRLGHQLQTQQPQHLMVDVRNAGTGVLDEVSPLSSSGSMRYVPGRISDVSGVGGLSPRPP